MMIFQCKCPVQIHVKSVDRGRRKIRSRGRNIVHTRRQVAETIFTRAVDSACVLPAGIDLQGRNVALEPPPRFCLVLFRYVRPLITCDCAVPPSK